VAAVAAIDEETAEEASTHRGRIRGNFLPFLDPREAYLKPGAPHPHEKMENTIIPQSSLQCTGQTSATNTRSQGAILRKAFKEADVSESPTDPTSIEAP